MASSHFYIQPNFGWFSQEMLRCSKTMSAIITSSTRCFQGIKMVLKTLDLGYFFTWTKCWIMKLCIWILCSSPSLLLHADSPQYNLNCQLIFGKKLAMELTHPTFRKGNIIFKVPNSDEVPLIWSMSYLNRDVFEWWTPPWNNALGNFLPSWLTDISPEKIRFGDDFPLPVW